MRKTCRVGDRGGVFSIHTHASCMKPLAGLNYCPMTSAWKEFYPIESDQLVTVCELIHFNQEAGNRMFVIFSLSICLV